MGLRKEPKKLRAIDWEFERAKVTKKRTRAAKKIVLKKFRISYHFSLKLQILCILYNFLPLVKLFLVFAVIGQFTAKTQRAQRKS